MVTLRVCEKTGEIYRKISKRMANRNHIQAICAGFYYEELAGRGCRLSLYDP